LVVLRGILKGGNRNPPLSLFLFHLSLQEQRKMAPPEAHGEQVQICNASSVSGKAAD